MTPCSALTAFKIAVSRWSWQVPALLFAAGYGIAVYALWIGIDFGTHWDEVIQYDPVVQTYQYQILLPHFYHDPSMIYWLDLASVADTLFVMYYSMVDRGIFWSRVYTSMSDLYTPITKPGDVIGLTELSPLTLHGIPFDLRFFILRARVLVMLVSSLGAVWVFLSLRAADLARPALAATLGGSVYIVSWEFGYHACWLPPNLPGPAQTKPSFSRSTRRSMWGFLRRCPTFETRMCGTLGRRSPLNREINKSLSSS